MTEQNANPPGTPSYKAAFRRKKNFAFVTTTLAVFFALCMFGSITVSRFQSRSYLELTSTSEIDGGFFKALIDQELEDQQLTKHIETATRNSVLVENRHIASQDLIKVREHVSFVTSKRKEGNQYRLMAQYDGLGSEGEKNLTRSLVRSLSRRIASMTNIEDAVQAVDQKFQIVKQKIEQNATRLQSELATASQMVDDLNLELSSVHQAVEFLGPDDRFKKTTNNTLAGQGNLDRNSMSELLGALQDKLSQIQAAENERELYNLGQAVAQINQNLQELGLSDESSKSMRIINASLPETNTAVRSILDILERCDTDSVQTQIGLAQNNLQTDAIQLREEVTAMNLLTSQIPESRYIVNSVSDASTVPADNSPGFGYILLIGMFSVGFGSVISMYYRPDYEDLGFDSVENAEQALGLPVIAQIQESQESDDQPNTVANTVVRYSEVALFGFLVLTILLCFVQPDLRQAFIESPVYGLSRMAGMFFG